MVSLSRGKYGSFRWLIVVNLTKKEDKTCWDVYLLELVSEVDCTPCSILDPYVCVDGCAGCGWIFFFCALCDTGILLCEDVMGINELVFEMFSDSLL